MNEKIHIEIQGHRGARGLYPENTLSGFIEAVKLGVNLIEMDVVISKDNKVIVSHEPWMNPDFCTKPNGQDIENNSNKKYNLYNMDYGEIVQYDCGKKSNLKFPSQRSIPENKPLLSEVITKIESFVKTNHIAPIKYNIEIKSEKEYDDIFNPKPDFFVDLVYSELKKQNILSKVILQSFDVRILQELKKKDQTITLSLLIENKNGLDNNLKELGFNPDIYAPEFILIDELLIKELHCKNIKLITWTVNEIDDMQRMISMGVKSIITDYPDRLINLIKK